MERNYKYDVLTELDLGVDIDLITPDVYTVNGTEVLDPSDEKLLEEDVIPHQDSKRYNNMIIGKLDTNIMISSTTFNNVRNYLDRDIMLKVCLGCVEQNTFLLNRQDSSLQIWIKLKLKSDSVLRKISRLILYYYC